MTDAAGLVACLLDHPDDQAPCLALGDWLEERADPDSRARAQLLRLRIARATAHNEPGRRAADDRAAVVLAETPALIGPLHPLLAHGFRPLAYPTALALFLMADYAAGGGPVAAGTAWEGELRQGPYAFPTALRVRTQDGNRFAGDMRQDFRAMYGRRVSGTFHFQGAAAGPHVAFVTHRMEGAASGPGLYQFRVSRRKRWSGTWTLYGGGWIDRMWLTPRAGGAARPRR